MVAGRPPASDNALLLDHRLLETATHVRIDTDITFELLRQCMPLALGVAYLEWLLLGILQPGRPEQSCIYAEHGRGYIVRSRSFTRAMA